MKPAVAARVAEQVQSSSVMNGMNGMQQEQRLAQDQVLDREAVGLGVRRLQLRLRDLDVPVAEIVPEKAVERLRRRAELEVARSSGRPRASCASSRSRIAWSSASNFAGVEPRRGWPSSEDVVARRRRSSAGSGRRSRACCRNSCRPRCGPPGSGCPGPAARWRRCRSAGRPRRTCRSGRAGRANCRATSTSCGPAGRG